MKQQKIHAETNMVSNTLTLSLFRKMWYAVVVNVGAAELIPHSCSNLRFQFKSSENIYNIRQNRIDETEENWKNIFGPNEVLFWILHKSQQTCSLHGPFSTCLYLVGDSFRLWINTQELAGCWLDLLAEEPAVINGAQKNETVKNVFFSAFGSYLQTICSGFGVLLCWQLNIWMCCVFNCKLRVNHYKISEVVAFLRASC